MPLLYSAPTPELAVELGEVRADASALFEVFKKLNAPLPDTFPKTAVLDIAGALRELPDGTARGCLRPLTEAQAQLAAIRSQHIVHEDKDRLTWGEDGPPPLFRGEPIDQHLRNLMSSVSTALQSANRIAAEEPEPEEPQAGIQPSDTASTESVIRHSLDAQKELLDERHALDQIRAPDSAHADALRRQVTDALVLNWLGRGELRMPRIISARLRRIAISLRDYPRLLFQSANLMAKGADFADYAYDKWNSLNDRIFKVGTQTIREIADDISDFAKKLEVKRRGAPPAQDDTPPPDFDIHRATELIHRGVAPPFEWRPFIRAIAEFW